MRSLVSRVLDDTRELNLSCIVRDRQDNSGCIVEMNRPMGPRHPFRTGARGGTYWNPKDDVRGRSVWAGLTWSCHSHPTHSKAGRGCS